MDDTGLVQPIVGVMDTSAIYFGSNFKTKLPEIIIASLTLIAGLVWNNTFTIIIDNYVPIEYRDGGNVIVKFIYAFVLTVIVVILISIILMYVPK
jgi:hypothetical protein